MPMGNTNGCYPYVESYNHRVHWGIIDVPGIKDQMYYNWGNLITFSRVDDDDPYVVHLNEDDNGSYSGQSLIPKNWFGAY